MKSIVTETSLKKKFYRTAPMCHLKSKYFNFGCKLCVRVVGCEPRWSRFACIPWLRDRLIGLHPPLQSQLHNKLPMYMINLKIIYDMVNIISMKNYEYLRRLRVGVNRYTYGRELVHHHNHIWEYLLSHGHYGIMIHQDQIVNIVRGTYTVYTHALYTVQYVVNS